MPLGYKGKQIKKFIQKSKFKNYKIDIIETGIATTIAQRIYKIKNLIILKYFLILNGDAIFDANLNEIFKKLLLKRKEISFICCQAEADFGTIGVLNKKVINFQRSLNFKSVNTNIKNFVGHVYSGMSIINKKVLEENFRRCKNFEKEFYPKVIRKYSSDIHNLKGFWYAMDNIKNYNTLNKKSINKNIFNRIYKLSKKFK